MDTRDFEETWQQLSRERSDLMSRRTDLENELADVRHKIKHLDEVLTHLAPLTNLDDMELYVLGNDISGLGLTDAVRHVLRTAEGRMSAREIQETLTKKGYDLTALSAPMANIYKIVSRLVENSNEVERERAEDTGRIFYKWKDVPF